jgi:hypothetical protein
LSQGIIYLLFSGTGHCNALRSMHHVGAREVWICQKEGKMLFTGLTNDEMVKITPLRRRDSQHLQSCQR